MNESAAGLPVEDAAVAAERQAGDSVFDLLVALPDAAPGELCASLSCNGAVIASGETHVPAASGEVLVELRLVEPHVELPQEDCELNVALNRDRLVSSYPSFGDYYIHRTLNPLGVETPMRIGSASWRRHLLSAPENLLTLHYHRFDGRTENINIWSWDGWHHNTPEQNELNPVGEDEYGLIFQLDLAEYSDGERPHRIGLLPRRARGWHMKDSSDRFWTPDLPREVWLIGGRSLIYPQRPSTDPHIEAAYIDDYDELYITLSHPMAAEELLPDEAIVRDESGARLPVKKVELLQKDEEQNAKALRLTLQTQVDIAAHDYSVEITGYGAARDLLPRRLLDDREIFFEGKLPLGAIYEPRQTDFRVFAPLAHAVQVALYDEATGDTGRDAIKMQALGKGIWEASVEGNLAGKFYTFCLDNPGMRPGNEVADIYAVNTVDSGRRCRITPLEKTHPRGWKKTKRGPRVGYAADAVIYEVHVRDFTVSETSGAEERGLYIGFSEKGTHLPEDKSIKTGIEHLVELGVTHVQLLPVQDFQNEESHRAYNWGYITNFFNSPEGLYATQLNDESRIIELKTLIQALHERGIGVILDVVYNHTGSNAAFDPTLPRYYYRQYADGSYSNGSGVGNDFRSEAPMARRYIIDSLKHWVQEYRVDGFRFDLMRLIDLETMHEIERDLRAIKPDILLYGEPWQAAHSPNPQPTDKEAIRGTSIGAFNDEWRNAVKGSPDGQGAGFIQLGHDRHIVEHGLAGFHHSWPGHPGQTVNYMTCHDNLTLYDKLRVSKPDADEEMLIAMIKLGFFILFTSQGVPFLHGGSEFGRSKGGHHNSYDAPDSVNQIDWSLKKKNRALYEYVRACIQLRKMHPAFRLRSNEEIAQRVQFHHAPTGDTIIETIDAAGMQDEPWKKICLLLNASDSENRTFDLPEGVWKIGFNREAGPEDREIQGACELAPKSGIVLHLVKEPQPLALEESSASSP